MPTTDELKTLLDALTARVNAIDGLNLSDASLAVLTVLAAKDTGLQTTIRQSILQMEQSINKVKTDLAALKTLVNTHLGI